MHKPHGYWTLERVQADALKYKTKSDWQKKSPSAYVLAYRHGLVEQLTMHMSGKTYKKWTTAQLKARAKKFQTITAWMDQDKASYSAARRRGLLASLTRHMARRSTPAPKLRGIGRIRYGAGGRKWSNKQVLKVARRYKNATAWWRASTPTYCAAQRRGLLKSAMKR